MLLSPLNCHWKNFVLKYPILHLQTQKPHTWGQIQINLNSKFRYDTFESTMIYTNYTYAADKNYRRQLQGQIPYIYLNNSRNLITENNFLHNNLDKCFFLYCKKMIIYKQISGVCDGKHGSRHIHSVCTLLFYVNCSKTKVIYLAALNHSE